MVLHILNEHNSKNGVEIMDFIQLNEINSHIFYLERLREKS